jgi:hypothetical protein
MTHLSDGMYRRDMTWRDTTPQALQDDLDLLAEQALDAARHLLEKNGEFYPFAVTLSDDGTAQMAGADPGEGEHPSSQAVLDVLYAGAAADRGGMRAAAFATPVQTPDGDGVRVEIEHRDGGPAIALLLAHRRKKLRRAIEFGQLTAAAGERRIWV